MRDLSRVVERAGLSIVRASSFNTLRFPAVALARVWKRLRGDASHDLRRPSPAVNRWLARVFALERHLVSRVTLLFGASLRRPALTLGPWGQGRETALVGAIFAVVVAVAAIWLALDRRPPEWDHANHLERSVVCADDLAHRNLRAVFERSSFYPPLVLCAAGLAYRLAPSDVAAAQAVVLVFLGLGIGAVYALARRFTGATEGVVAALVFATAPFVVFSSLRFQLDLPLASMVALMLVVLLRTDTFEHRGWSTAVGVVLGLGMLTKPPFVVYVVAPLVLVAARIRSRRALANLALAAFVGVGLGLPCYGPRLLSLAPEIGSGSFRQAAEAGHPDPLTSAALTFYPRWFVTQFGLVAVLLFGLGLGVAGRRRHWLLVAALLPAFALFELLQNKNLRYTLPLLPVAAVLAGVGFGALPARLRAGGRVLLVVAGVVQASATAFGVPHFSLPVLDVPFVVKTPPVRDDWRQREILTLLARDSRGRPATVSVVPNYSLFSTSNFRYYALRDGYQLRFLRAWEGEPVGIEYMVLKSGDQGPSWTAERPRRIAERLAHDPHFARVFPVIGEFPLPDGSTATVRARRLEAGPAVRPAVMARAVERAIRARLGEVARDVEGLEIRLTYDDAILRGRIARVELRAARATVGDLTRRNAALARVGDLQIAVDDLLVNPFSAWADRRLNPLDAGLVRIERATILAADFNTFLRQLKGFRRVSVTFEPGALVLAAPQPGPDVSARVRLVSANDRPFALAFERVRVGGVPLPGALVDWVVRGYDPSLGLASRLPVRLEVGRVEITPDALRITAGP